MIYIIVGEFMYSEASNVLVTTNKEKAFSCTLDDFAGCNALWVETWNDEELISNIRLF